MVAAISLLAFLIADAARPRAKVPPRGQPRVHRDGGYVGSGACQPCHAQQYESWKQSYHRSMTRRPNELPFSGERSPKLPTSLSLYGQTWTVGRSDHEIMVKGPDLHVVAAELRMLRGVASAVGQRAKERFHHAFAQAPVVERQLALVTGSHHYLAFWLEGGPRKELRRLPFVYLLAEKRWLPQRDAFLAAPDMLPHLARWNANCIQCHSVAGRPRQTQGHDPSGQFWEYYDTDVAELGIACEACHGPGQQHARHFRNPARRHFSRNRPAPPPGLTRAGSAIFVPGQDDDDRGSQACGQCHSYFLPAAPEQWWDSGFTSAAGPGQPLEQARLVLSPSSSHSAQLSQRSLGASDLFWANGGIMVGGREYNGLVESACNQQGRGRRKLACTSCHSLHAGAPDHQLDPQFVATAAAVDRPDNMCLSCHQQIQPTHSRHSSDSPGARCVNCHMPKTSYALLQGTASHLIDSPSLTASPRYPGYFRPPDACALCHYDKSRDWLITEQAKFRSHTAEQREVAAGAATSADIPWGVRRALSGNAAVRALFAFAMSEPADKLDERLPARRAWAQRTLALLEGDNYAAVRQIAQRGRRRFENEKLVVSPQLDRRLKKIHEAADQTQMAIAE